MVGQLKWEATMRSLIAVLCVWALGFLLVIGLPG